MEKQMIVYMSKNMINGKVYIGQTVRSLNIRISGHMHDAFSLKKNHHFYNALRKYGENCFIWGIVCECKSLEEMNQKEIEYILQYKSVDQKFGYNIKVGGSGGYHSEETKNKIRIANTGRKHSCETRKRMSVSKSGVNNPHFGKKHSKEWKDKISASHFGIRQTSESIEKIRQKKIGFRHTEDTKIKIGEASRGRIASDKAKRNMSAAQKRSNGKPVLMIDKTTRDIIDEFECVSDAVRKFGNGNKSSIFQALKGKRKSACGFIWKYAKEENTQLETTQ